MYTETKYYPCSCRLPCHSLAIKYWGFEYPDSDAVSVYINVECAGIVERIKAAFAVLRGRYEHHEVELDMETFRNFADDADGIIVKWLDNQSRVK